MRRHSTGIVQFTILILCLLVCVGARADVTPILSASLPPSTTAATTAYRPLCDNAVVLVVRGLWGAEGQMWQPIPVPGGVTLSYFMLSVVSAPGTGGSYTFTIYKKSGTRAGTATALRVTLSGNNTTALDNTHSVRFAQGDLVCVQCTTNSSPSSLRAVRWCIKAAMRPGSSMILGGLPNDTSGWPSNTTTNYGTFQGCAGNGAGRNGPFEVCPLKVTAQNLYVYLPFAVTTGTWTVKLDVNFTGTVLAAKVSSGQIGSDTTHTVSVAAGSLVGTDMVPVSTPTAQTSIMWGMEILTPLAGQSIGTYDITPIPSSTRSTYNGISGSDNYPTEANVANVICGGVVVSQLNFYSALATGYTCSVTRRQNFTNTSIVASLTRAGSGLAKDTTHTVLTHDYDLFSILTTNPGGGTLYPCVGLVFYMPPSSRKASSNGLRRRVQ